MQRGAPRAARFGGDGPNLLARGRRDPGMGDRVQDKRDGGLRQARLARDAGQSRPSAISAHTRESA
jgi:hypothetical protein